MLQVEGTKIEEEEEEEEKCNGVVPFLKVNFYVEYPYDKYVFIYKYKLIKNFSMTDITRSVNITSKCKKISHR
jgi:hypothetical protein